MLDFKRMFWKRNRGLWEAGQHSRIAGPMESRSVTMDDGDRFAKFSVTRVGLNSLRPWLVLASVHACDGTRTIVPGLSFTVSRVTPDSWNASVMESEAAAECIWGVVRRVTRPDDLRTAFEAATSLMQL